MFRKNSFFYFINLFLCIKRHPFFHFAIFFLRIRKYTFYDCEQHG